MIDLFTHNDPSQQAYISAYSAFSELRESFHRFGRMDDSNAKLDEVAKLFATYLAFKTGQIRKFPTPDSAVLVSELQSAFSETVKLPQYQIDGDTTIFGTQPFLAIRPGDEKMATDMVRLVRRCVDWAFKLRASDRPFDILNEAFGHFIRDNFRGNIEDAQYMTPPEVTDFMAELALHDISEEALSSDDVARPLTVLDPSCGVGSFLCAVYQRARTVQNIDEKHLRLLGQDKVERMVRLATLNLEMFEVKEHHITLGNSLERGSPLDSLNGRVDLILTNPPFGAKFEQAYVDMVCGSNTPFFSGRHRTISSVDSELLFVDRSLRLLRDGGRLLILVPDGVVSARGMSALLRQHLAHTVALSAVIELPPVTFAQAGTRTKTAILYLKKGAANRQTSVFMGVANHLGFQVSSRKGVQIKIPQGKNDLLAIADAYKCHRNNIDSRDIETLSSNPSCVAIPQSTVFKGNWTPKHYSAERFETVAEVIRDGDFEMTPLRDMVEFYSRKRRSETWRRGCAFISVRHIFGEGFMDMNAVYAYAPKTPGLPVYPGELLISRINPRIPRVCVVPDFGMEALCSSEFEVMKVKDGVDAYVLAYMLQTDVVQNQIRSLTSGTSASHNRIRTSELEQVLIPVAKRGTKKANVISQLASEYRNVLISLASNSIEVANLREREKEIFNS